MGADKKTSVGLLVYYSFIDQPEREERGSEWGGGGGGGGQGAQAGVGGVLAQEEGGEGMEPRG